MLRAQLRQQKGFSFHVITDDRLAAGHILHYLPRGIAFWELLAALVPAKLAYALLVPPPARRGSGADGRFPVGRNASLGCWTFPVVSKGTVSVHGAFAGLRVSVYIYTHI